MDALCDAPVTPAQARERIAVLEIADRQAGNGPVVVSRHAEGLGVSEPYSCASEAIWHARAALWLHGTLSYIVERSDNDVAITACIGAHV